MNFLLLPLPLSTENTMRACAIFLLSLNKKFTHA